MRDDGDIEIRHDEEGRRFVAELEGGSAYVAYRPVEGALDLVSTWVPPVHRNRGIGERIVVHALEYARERGLAVIPTCPFVPRILDQNPEFKDLART